MEQMEKAKNLLAMALCSLFLVLALVGCGSDGNGGRVAELQKQLDAVKQQLADAQAAGQGDAAALAQIIGSLTDTQKALAGLTYGQMTTVDLDATARQVDVLKVLAGSLAATGQGVATVIDHLNQTASAIATARQQAESHVSTLTQQRDAAQAQVDTLTSQLAASQGDRGALQQQLVAAQGQVASLNGQIVNSNAQVDSLNNQVASLQTSLASLQSQVDVGSTTIAVRDATIAALQTSAASLQAQVTSLQGQLDAANAQVFNLQGQLASVAPIIDVTFWPTNISVERAMPISPTAYFPAGLAGKTATFSVVGGGSLGTATIAPDGSATLTFRKLDDSSPSNGTAYQVSAISGLHAGVVSISSSPPVCQTWNGYTLSAGQRYCTGSDGTTREHGNGLVWLVAGDCAGSLSWTDATAWAANLAAGQCGLNDGSAAGDWRLPTKQELAHLMSGGSIPEPVSAATPQAFTSLLSDSYWTSTAGSAAGTDVAISMADASVSDFAQSTVLRVLAVRYPK